MYINYKILQMNCLMNVRKEPLFKPLIKPKRFQDKRKGGPKHTPNIKKETVIVAPSKEAVEDDDNKGS